MTTIENTKKCTGGCERELPATLEYFYKGKRGKFGLRGDCKDCFKKANAKYKQTDAGKKVQAKANAQYRQTDSGKRTRAKSRAEYLQSPAGKKAVAKSRAEYQQSPAGKKSKAESDAKSRNSPVSFKTYASRLELSDTVKKASDGKLLVVCKKCGEFFRPTKSEVDSRVRVLDGHMGGECNFYCSQKCKDECGTFKRIKFAVGDPNATTTARVSTDPEVVKMVLEREDGKCEICDSTDRVEVHHYIGATREPMLTNDPDNLHALCHLHHKKITKACGISYTRRPACDIKQ